MENWEEYKVVVKKPIKMMEWKEYVVTVKKPENIVINYRGIIYSNVNAFEICLDILSMVGYTQIQMFHLLKDIKIEDGGAVYNLRRRSKALEHL